VRLASLVIAAAIVGAAAPAGAEPRTTLAVASVLAGPSLRETGRVGDVPFAHATGRIELVSERTGGLPPKDPVVRPRRGDVQPPAGSLSATIIAHQLVEPVAALQDCRIEEARRQRRRWDTVAAGRVTLRWTILLTGTVAQVEVVPIDPLDLHVLDCIKRTMTTWTFARPDGGAVAVAQPFAFR
jgi:hypothetical protein